MSVDSSVTVTTASPTIMKPFSYFSSSSSLRPINSSTKTNLVSYRQFISSINSDTTITTNNYGNKNKITNVQHRNLCFTTKLQTNINNNNNNASSKSNNICDSIVDGSGSTGSPSATTANANQFVLYRDMIVPSPTSTIFQLMHSSSSSVLPTLSSTTIPSGTTTTTNNNSYLYPVVHDILDDVITPLTTTTTTTVVLPSSVSRHHYEANVPPKSFSLYNHIRPATKTDTSRVQVQSLTMSPTNNNKHINKNHIDGSRIGDDTATAATCSTKKSLSFATHIIPLNKNSTSFSNHEENVLDQDMIPFKHHHQNNNNNIVPITTNNVTNGNGNTNIGVVAAKAWPSHLNIPKKSDITSTTTSSMGSGQRRSNLICHRRLRTAVMMIQSGRIGSKQHHQQQQQHRRAYSEGATAMTNTAIVQTTNSIVSSSGCGGSSSSNCSTATTNTTTNTKDDKGNTHKHLSMVQPCVTPIPKVRRFQDLYVLTRLVCIISSRVKAQSHFHFSYAHSIFSAFSFVFLLTFIYTNRFLRVNRTQYGNVSTVPQINVIV